MRSIAHVSEHTTHPSPRRPSASGRKPWGSRTATRRSFRRKSSENAPCACDAASIRAVLAARRLRPRVEVEEDLGVAGRLEDRALPREELAQVPLVHQIAVVADGDLAVHALDEQRLRVLEPALARGRIPDVADGGGARQPGERLAAEDVGDVAHAPRRAQFQPVGRDDAAALLPAVLEGVEPQVGQIRRLGVAVDAEDAAFVLELVEHDRGRTPSAIGFLARSRGWCQPPYAGYEAVSVNTRLKM